jgi:hypothetical protein
MIKGGKRVPTHIEYKLRNIISLKCETVDAEYVIMRTSSILADNTMEYSMRTNHLTNEMKTAYRG